MEFKNICNKTFGFIEKNLIFLNQVYLLNIVDQCFKSMAKISKLELDFKMNFQICSSSNNPRTPVLLPLFDSLICRN